MDGQDPKSAEEKKAERSNLIEEQIKEAQRRKDERLFLEELSKRISIARDGRVFSEKKDYGQAVTCYRRFMSITAKAVNVDIADLKPQLFDEKNRKGECLLISSIVFDMLKILDKLDTDTAKEERKQYHRLFIRFTLGQPFQTYAAENLRKFIIYRKSIRNKSEFWATYQAIRVKKFCAVATWAYGTEDSPEVRRLRRFRDERLASSMFGRAFVRWYYRNGQCIAQTLDRMPGARKVARSALGAFSRRL